MILSASSSMKLVGSELAKGMADNRRNSTLSRRGDGIEAARAGGESPPSGAASNRSRYRRQCRRRTARRRLSRRIDRRSTPSRMIATAVVVTGRRQRVGRDYRAPLRCSMTVAVSVRPSRPCCRDHSAFECRGAWSGNHSAGGRRGGGSGVIPVDQSPRGDAS